MPGRAKHHFWRRCRVYFRRFRISVWLTLLAVVCALVYLDVVGLPGFAKRWVIEELRTHGLDLEFSRLRLDWYHGIVADDVSFDRAKEPHEPRFTAKRLTIHPDFRALATLHLKVDSLGLRQGRIEWPIVETNASLAALNVEDIEARLRLMSGDAWELDDFQARFGGANIAVSGFITNASSISQWKWFGKRQTNAPGVWLTRLQKISSAIGQISYSTPPALRLLVSGDAEKPEEFTARFYADAHGIQTPWGDAKRIALFARSSPQSTGEISQAVVEFNGDAVQTPWGKVERLRLYSRVTAQSASGTAGGDINLDAEAIQTRWGYAKNLGLVSQFTPDVTNGLSHARLRIEAATVQTQWGDAHNLAFNSELGRHIDPPTADDSLSTWTKALPWTLGWVFEANGLTAKKIDASHIVVGGNWLAPNLEITNLSASLGGGTLDAKAKINVESRELASQLNSTIDPRAVEILLTPKTRLWLSQFAWLTNPHVRGSAELVLPSWTNRQPDWRAEVQPTLRLTGEFAGTNVAYRGVQALWARSHLTYSNLVWRLPDLQVHRPEGTLFLSHHEDDHTKDYHWQIRGPIDPRALRPVLSTNQIRAFNIVNFNGPVTFDGDVWGRLYEYDRIGAQFRLSATNFSVRGHVVDTFDSKIRYTNRVLECIKPNLTHGAQMMYADGLTVEFPTERIYFTNGFSMADPRVVANAIGPKVEQALMPYHFIHPPVVHLEGYVPLRGSSNADLRVVVEGGPFEWWKFNVPHIEGKVHWLGNTLLLTNIATEFYEGKGGGHAYFDFGPGRGADYNFRFEVTNADLRALMADIGTRSNRMEGVLSGQLVITNASTTNWNTWNGRGRVTLTDGFLWDVPLFGVFSPILNGIIPGLGGGRATDATAKFIITNGVIFSDSLAMRSTMMRLQYEGTVAFDGQVDARVEAELLRDTWLLGRVLSLAFKPVTKLLEYRVTGTLSKPKPEPLHFVPRLLMMPFHPLRTLEDLLPSSTSSADVPTAAPP